MMASEREILDECRRLISDGLHEEAVILLTQAIAVTPRHELFYQRAELYECLGEFSKALDDVSLAVQLEPNETAYLEFRGLLLSSRLGRVEESLGDFITASSLDPSRPYSHQQLTLGYLQLGRLDAACDHAEKAIAVDDSNGWSHYCLGQCRLAAKRFHSAAREFESALRLGPQSARFWIGLGAACENIGELERAEVCLRNAIRLEASASSYIDLAAIQLDKGNPRGAIDSLVLK